MCARLGETLPLVCTDPYVDLPILQQSVDLHRVSGLDALSCVADQSTMISPPLNPVQNVHPSR